MSERLWEIDVARTLAIGMMVVYHAAYDVTELAPHLGVDAFSGGWRALQVATGSSFLFLVGVSFVIADAGARARGLDRAARARRRARRALFVLGAAALVSLGTLVALGDEYVRFGILHAIGVSMLLAIPASRLGLWNLPGGVAVIAAGLWLEDRTFGTAWLAPLGLRPDGELGVDYYPLLPWFSAVMLGLVAGRLLYPGGRRCRWLAALARVPDGRPRRLAGLPGRQALPIYLVHQLILFPVIAGLLMLSGDLGGR